MMQSEEKIISGVAFGGVAVLSVIVTWGGSIPVVVAAAVASTGTMAYGISKGEEI